MAKVAPRFVTTSSNRHHQCQIPANLNVLIHVFLILYVEQFDLMLFAYKGLDNMHAGQVFLHQSIQFAQFLLDDCEERANNA